MTKNEVCFNLNKIVGKSVVFVQLLREHVLILFLNLEKKLIMPVHADI